MSKCSKKNNSSVLSRRQGRRQRGVRGVSRHPVGEARHPVGEIVENLVGEYMIVDLSNVYVKTIKLAPVSVENVKNDIFYSVQINHL